MGGLIVPMNTIELRITDENIALWREARRKRMLATDDTLPPGVWYFWNPMIEASDLLLSWERRLGLVGEDEGDE